MKGLSVIFLILSHVGWSLFPLISRNSHAGLENSKHDRLFLLRFGPYISDSLTDFRSIENRNAGTTPWLTLSDYKHQVVQVGSTYVSPLLNVTIPLSINLSRVYAVQTGPSEEQNSGSWRNLRDIVILPELSKGEIYFHSTNAEQMHGNGWTKCQTIQPCPQEK